MKKKYGSVTPVYEGKSTNIDKDTLLTNGHGVSHQDLCDIIRARVEEILRLILLEMPNSEYETLVPDGLVLTGGSSNLAGIEALGRNTLQLPVRVGLPMNIYGISDALQDPAYATSVGLLLWGAKYKGKRTWQGGGFGGGLRRMFSRFFSLFR
jgi:cell division protein FtsA